MFKDGKYEYSSEGNYSQGQRNGWGTYIDADGHKSEGEFKDSILHGFGTRTYDWGQMSGVSKNGVFDGQVIAFLKTGLIVVGVFKDGVYSADYSFNGFDPKTGCEPLERTFQLWQKLGSGKADLSNFLLSDSYLLLCIGEYDLSGINKFKANDFDGSCADTTKALNLWYQAKDINSSIVLNQDIGKKLLGNKEASCQLAVSTKRMKDAQENISKNLEPYRELCMKYKEARQSCAAAGNYLQCMKIRFGPTETFEPVCKFF